MLVKLFLHFADEFSVEHTVISHDCDRVTVKFPRYNSPDLPNVYGPGSKGRFIYSTVSSV